MHKLGSVSETDLIPHFHLDVLGAAGHGWCVSNEEFDIVNEGLHIYAKIIGDYRHMTSAALRKAYIVMQTKEFEDHMAICYLVETAAACSRDDVWVMLSDGCRYAYERIRRMSIDRFYELVFGDADAFCRLHGILPDMAGCV